METKLQNIRVETNHTWKRYFSTAPDIWKEYHKGWAFKIDSEVKYFPGAYEDAEREAKEYAMNLGIDIIYAIGHF